MSQHMRDYMDGRIDSTEYMRRIKADTDAMVEAIRRSRPEQERKLARARAALRLAQRILRGKDRP